MIATSSVPHSQGPLDDRPQAEGNPKKVAN